MARIKRKPKAYREGGRIAIPPDEPLVGFGREVDEPVASVDEPPPPAITSPTVQTDDDPVMQALHATQRAEQLQRQQAVSEKADNAVAVLSEHKQAFLREHPEILKDPYLTHAMGMAYQHALRRGIPDDTPQMDQEVMRSIDTQLGWIEQLQREQVQKSREAFVQSIERRQSPPPAPPPPRAEAPPLNMATTMIDPPQRARRNSIAMSAPVSRDAPSYGGGKVQSRKIELSPEQRAIARASFTAPDMSDDDKEMAVRPESSKAPGQAGQRRVWR